MTTEPKGDAGIRVGWAWRASDNGKLFRVGFIATREEFIAAREEAIPEAVSAGLGENTTGFSMVPADALAAAEAERDALRAKLEAVRAALEALATELEGKAAPRVRPAYTYYDDDLESEITMPETRAHALVRPSVYAVRARAARALLDAPAAWEKPPHAYQPIAPGYIEGLVDALLASREDAGAKWVVGRVMQITRLRANPEQVAAVVAKRLDVPMKGEGHADQG